MELNYIAPLNDLSYGIVAENFLENMVDSEVDVQLFPIALEDNKLKWKPLTFHENPRNINRTTLRIWHQDDLHTRAGGGKHFGFPIFELDTFSNIEKESIKSCDEVIVCSEWAKRIVFEQTKKVAHVVPLGFDPRIFKPGPKNNTPNTIFFNCGKWEYRKGHDILLKCFEKAFNPSDNVELWMVSENVHPYADGPEWEKLYKNSPMSGKIRIIPRLKSQKNVYYIMGRVDCGVFPSRAEGWNLGMLELLACGKHVIATDYSGHTQFNQSGVRNIEIDSTEIAKDGIWFNGQGSWAHMGQPQEDQIIDNMRDIHSKKQAGELLENTEAIYNTQKFTWKNSTMKLLEVLYETNKTNEDPQRLT